MTYLNPYISFRNQAREALDFYQSVFGGEIVARSTFGEFHASEDPAEFDLIMHSQLETPKGFVLMVADTPSHMEYNPGGNISVSVSGEDEAELRGYWDGLTAGGTVTVPMEVAPWGGIFGMCIDRFGVSWLLNVNAAS